MADVESSRNTNPFQKTILPYTPLHHYSRPLPAKRDGLGHTQEIKAVVFDKRRIHKHDAIVPRYEKQRNQVGLTNRCRHDKLQSSDILGSSQKHKSTLRTFNQSFISKITGESAPMNVNMDMNRPYRFRQCADRPQSMSVLKEPASAAVSTLMRPATSNTPRGSIKAQKILRISRHVPESMHPSNPKDIIKYHAHKGRTFTGPDLQVHCLDMDWDIHSAFIQKSGVLNEMFSKYLDIVHHQAKKKEKEEIKLPPILRKNSSYMDRVKIGEISHYLKLDITDTDYITKIGFAIAVGNLYHDELLVEIEEVVEVLAAACLLKFVKLQKHCVKLMLKNIHHWTVCGYYNVCSKFNEQSVLTACERWLELNLVNQLSMQIQLRDLNVDLLLKTVKSPRLFVYNEYSVYKALSYWLFLQLNPSIQLMPTHSTVLAFYNGYNHTAALLETEEGSIYENLFSVLRMHGIMDSDNIQDIQTMNILPQKWVIDVLAMHYQSLQCGGDMAMYKHFNDTAIRQGFILDEDPQYHTEVLSLHGFHFMLQACHEPEDDSYQFYIRRLKPNDSVLSFRQCERQTFSLRPDRLVVYAIRAQYTTTDGDHKMYDTGPVSHRFGLATETSMSQVVTLRGLTSPVYVTFMLLFPSS